MIKIVEIKGGLQELQKRKESFLKGSIWEQELQKKPSLQEQLRSYQDFQNITRAQLELAMGLTAPRNRENEIVIHASAEGARQFQEALQIEATETLYRIERERERERQTIRRVEMLRSLPTYFGTRGETTDDFSYGVDPYRPSFTEPPIRSIDPETGNTVVTQGSHSATFSRDMTEEQMIAYFDSLD